MPSSVFTMCTRARPADASASQKYITEGKFHVAVDDSCCACPEKSRREATTADKMRDVLVRGNGAFGALIQRLPVRATTSDAQHPPALFPRTHAARPRSSARNALHRVVNARAASRQARLLIM